MATRGKARRPSNDVDVPIILPSREWDKATALMRIFAMTGFIKNARPASLLFISEPGSGKTELIDRFNQNPFLQYASDVTTRGLYPILKLAKTGACTHLVASEFQKLLLRKASVAEATLGTLCQAMEEGVGRVMVGNEYIDFGGARLGLLGAVTHETAKKWRVNLRELGFWSRVAAFHWEMPMEQLRAVMGSISDGDMTDLSPVILKTPESPIIVDFPRALSRQFEDFVFKRFREHTVLRVFARFRTLAMASALLEDRDVVKARDVEHVVAFHAYWQAMER